MKAWGDGDLRARDRLLPHVYKALRKQAAAYLRRERPGYSLQPTELVHEVYLRLVNQRRMRWQNRAQFFGVAAQMMRRILVDRARAAGAAKRPDPSFKVSLDGNLDMAAVDPPSCDLLLLDRALNELGAMDPRKGQIVELKYFGGLSEHEIAEVLAVSRPTIAREWRLARVWLYRRITAGPSSPEHGS